jgi:hypothetical protein
MASSLLAKLADSFRDTRMVTGEADGLGGRAVRDPA